MVDRVQALQAHLDKEVVNKLRNTDALYPKLLVVFSGNNAVGKTSLARYLEDNLQAVVLSNDDVRTAIMKASPDISKDELNQTMWDYIVDDDTFGKWEHVARKIADRLRELKARARASNG